MVAMVAAASFLQLLLIGKIQAHTYSITSSSFLILGRQERRTSLCIETRTATSTQSSITVSLDYTITIRLSLERNKLLALGCVATDLTFAGVTTVVYGCSVRNGHENAMVARRHWRPCLLKGWMELDLHWSCMGQRHQPLQYTRGAGCEDTVH